ncbi:zinc finger protein 77-like [Ostrinia nubilalis]|uniref:zinc finger protein 77-like n=1 Tax=Ostrinia nubilalis TaxID=29057 RepID=UPI003082629D
MIIGYHKFCHQPFEFFINSEDSLLRHQFGTTSTGDDNTTTIRKVNDINASNKTKKLIDFELNQQKKIGREGIMSLISSTNALPFKWWNNIFLCFYCDKKYSDFADLETHNSAEHQVTEIQIIKALIKLGKYQKVKVNYTNFVCKLCNHIAEDFNSLKEHIGSEHKMKLNADNDGVFPFRMNSDGFNCAMCPQSFHNYRLLNQHINVHFPNFVCEQCGVGFATDERLKAHTQSHDTGSYKCEMCDKVFRRIAAKKDHVMRIHMKVYKHRCPHCKELFKEYAQRIRHMVRVHGVKVPEFRCSMCPDKVYMFSGQLRVHEKVHHLKTRKYECKICQKTCSNSAVLRDHMVCHSGERNFECQVCKKKYGRKKTLAEHMRIHNNDRRFVCQYCSSAFVQNCSLKSHMRTHHRNEIKIE